MRQLVLVITLLFMSTASIHAATGNQGPRAWRIRDLASAPVSKVELRDEKTNRIIATLETRQMLLFYAAMTAIEKVAEINAELFVVEGEEPNAFATVARLNEDGDVQNMVGFTFGMLEIVGMDVDAAAAIIGHELAHLKLNHIEEKKDAIQNSRTTTFSAAATRYTRDNERESDYLGSVWAVEAGYDPAGAVRVHEQLYKLSKRHVGFSGSHPSSIERLTVLKSLVRRLSK